MKHFLLILTFILLLNPIVVNADSISAYQDSSLSGNGRYTVFVSDNTNLVPLANSCNIPLITCNQVFVKDNDTGEIELISVSDSYNGNGNSIKPSISKDGRYVTFISNSNNLIQANTTGYHLYLRDRLLEKTVIVDINAINHINNGEVFEGKISGNGEVIIFSSDSTNLVSLNTTKIQVYYYNLKTQTTRIISKNNNVASNENCQNININDDGNYITFDSASTNLDSNITNYSSSKNIFLYHSVSNKISLISASNQLVGIGDSVKPAISSNGNIICYQTKSTAFVTSEYYQIVSFNFALMKSEVITSFDSILGNNDSTNVSISGDGVTIIFMSKSTNLTISSGEQIFHYNLLTRKMNLITADAQNRPLTTSNINPKLSYDGKYFTYTKINSVYSEIITTKIDTVAPIITYTGETKIIKGDEIDFRNGINVTDNFDDNVGYEIISDDHFNINEIGKYTISVEALDSAGNFSFYAFTIFVNPLVTAFPIYVGPQTVSIPINTRKHNLGSTLKFIDENGASLEAYFIDKSDLDFTKLGSYQVIVGAKNEYGNETQVNIEIIIIKKTSNELLKYSPFIVFFVLVVLIYLFFDRESLRNIKYKLKKEKQEDLSIIE